MSVVGFSFSRMETVSADADLLDEMVELQQL